MTDYVKRLMELATTKHAGWQHDDCPVVRTSTIETSKAWKSVLAETKENEGALFKKCELAIQAQARYRREAKGSNQHIPQPKMLSAWLRAGRWEEEIGSHAEIKERSEVSQCAESGCKRPVHGPRYDKCVHHTKDHSLSFDAEKRSYLRSEGVTMESGESMSSYADKCRAHLARTNPIIARRLKI